MRMPESVAVTVPCIFDFRFVSPKLAFPQWFSILWFHLYALFVRCRSGSTFDQGLFIAHLLLKIIPSMHFSPFIHLFHSLYPHLALCVCQFPYFVADLSLVCYESLYVGLLFWQFPKVVSKQRWTKWQQKMRIRDLGECKWLCVFNNNS